MISAPGAQTGRLRKQAEEFAGQLPALSGGRQNRDVGRLPSAPLAAAAPSFDAAAPAVELAPVLSPPGSVAPGGTAQIEISLVNEDEQSARIVLYSGGLFGEGGAQIPVDRISFEPRELTLLPGTTGTVVARVTVPAQIPCGLYSGLVRASQLDHLHAVLVVQVERP